MNVTVTDFQGVVHSICVPCAVIVSVINSRHAFKGVAFDGTLVEM